MTDFLAVALLVVALGQEVGGQESPDLAVPVHAAAADAGAEQKRAQVAHRQRLLIDVVADGQRVVGDVLKQVVAPHVAQFVLGKSGGEIRGGVAPGAALQSQYVEARFAQFLAHDGAGPAEADQHRIDGFERGGHDQRSVQPGRPLKPTVG